MYTVGCVVHCLIEKCCTFIYKKWLYVSYIFTNLKNERDTANMETRLHGNDFSTVITVCCRTNNRGKVSPSPSNITNIQILGTWKSEYFKLVSTFLEFKPTHLCQLGFSLHKIFLLQHSYLVPDLCISQKSNNLF